MSNLQTPVRLSERELADAPLADVAPAPSADIPPPPPLASVVGYEAAGHVSSMTTSPGWSTPGLGFPPPAFPPPTVALVAPPAAQLSTPLVETPSPRAPTPAVSDLATSDQLTTEIADAAVEHDEPVDTPAPAVAPIQVPTLGPIPTPAVPVPPSVPQSHHPAQKGTQSAADWMNTNAPAATTARPRKAKSAPGRGVVRTLMVAVLAVAIGAGARIGYDKYEARDDVAGPIRPVVDGNVLTAWPNIAPPAIRYTDTETMITTGAGTRTLTTHRDLTTGDRIVNVVSTDAVGAVVSYDLEIRSDEAFVRATPDATWEPTPVDAAVALVGDEMLTAVFTVSDLFPSQATPYTTVLDNVDRQLSLGAIRQNINVTDTTLTADPAADATLNRAPITPGAPVPTPVTHYRVIIDTEAFRAAEGAAFQTWERQLGRIASPRLEVWVDADGIVRQIVFEVDGAMVTQKLFAGAPVSNRLEDRTPGVIGAADPASASSDATAGG